MLFKKSKAIIAAALSAAMVTNAMVVTMASAAGDVAGTRTKAEAFGDDTYAERFLSLYDDVMTNGVTNGYMSSNGSSSGSFGIPFHAVEEVIIEAPDYGHETTSEAMSYLVWVAAMRDNIAKNMTDLVDEGDLTYTADLAKAWKTMENMIPTVQDNFWGGGDPVSAQYCGEYDNPEDCPDAHAADASRTASNPIHSYFTTAYPNDSGLYLMHWLADVENWYGFGTGTNFTFINTFQRGEQESCWETVPHPCVEEKKAGNAQKGMKGIFNRDAQVTNQYAYTNAPDAEDRAIQGVYDANRWGVGDSNVSALAAKMGDQLRNNMFDKYYQTIGVNTSWTNGNAGYNSAHYLMNWYTSWGGALASTGQKWVWQIGCSHAHEFYQNPLAAFALIQDSELKSGMKAQGAVTDYTTSLERQMEFYLWLQSSNGPIAGGATNSYHGRYDSYPSGVSTFYGMMYTEHPVYADPGSNHWIGNQVWAVQRLAELYYWVKEEGDTTGVKPGGMTLEAALKQILDKWVEWFLNNTVLTDDGDFYIPATLNWSGQPDEWSKDSVPTNSGLTCEVTAYGNADFGCVSSLANTLLYYAKANGATAADAEKEWSGIGSAAVGGINDNVAAGSGAGVAASDLAGASLYLAQQLLDRQWDIGRDDIGLTRTDHNGSLARFFSQPVHVPTSYTGTMPNKDSIQNGITFLDIRSMYLDSANCVGAKTSDEAIALVKELQAAYEKDVAAGAKWSGSYSASSSEGADELAKFENVAAVELQYHRFWHAGDILMALGVMAELYPEIEPTIQYGEEPVTEALYGDCEDDGDVDIMDVIHLSKSLMGNGKLTEQGAINADVDLSDSINTTDALNIMKYLVKLIDELPV